MRLPTYEELQAIDEFDQILDIKAEIENDIIAIETDLDYRGDTEEWFRRATAALKLHRIAVAEVNRRINELKRGKTYLTPDQNFQKGQERLAKAITKRNHELLVIEQQKLSVQKERAKAINHKIDYIGKTSYLTAFHHCAWKMIPDELRDQIVEAANEKMNKAIDNALGEI